MIFYEAPHKLKNTLSDLLDTLGDREIAIVKELTKIHETVFRTTLKGALEYYEENPPKGEFVLIIKGAEAAETDKQYTLEDAVLMAKAEIAGGLSTSDAAKLAAKETGLKKGDIYKALLG